MSEWYFHNVGFIGHYVGTVFIRIETPGVKTKFWEVPQKQKEIQWTNITGAALEDNVCQVRKNIFPSFQKQGGATIREGASVGVNTVCYNKWLLF